jgi:hypothetical protein
MRGADYLPRVAFFLSVAVLVYAYGVLSHKYQLFPFVQIRDAANSVRLVVDEFGMITKTKPEKHLFDARYEGNGVVSYDPEHMEPGPTLVTSFFEGELQIRLLAEDGSVINRWPVSINSIWENFDHIMPEADRPKTDWNVVFNGVSLLPDGAVVFPMLGLVKMDRCGSVIWKVPVMAHHSVEQTPRGSYWTGSRHYVAEESKHPPIQMPYEIDTILEVSGHGEILREIAILDIFIENDMLPVLFANNRYFNPNSELDVVHLNDVEEIPADRIDRFPSFEAGDLLVSLRQVNMVLVLDPDTREIKWHQIGPWIQQHDADWGVDGNITVFDNRYDGSNGMVLGGSNVISINPVTREANYLYGKLPDQELYSPTQGDQQVLNNGNVLITESDAGRVIEVTPSGRIVWEYINRYSEEEVVRISDAIRYSADYLSVNDWSCD